MRSVHWVHQTNASDKMNTLHRIGQAEILTALTNHSDIDTASMAYDLSVAGDWTGSGRIEFGAPHGSSTGPFPDIFSFTFAAISDFGSAEFGAVDLAFAYWRIDPSGNIESFSVLTNQIDGFALSLQLGEDAAKLEGKKFATLQVGTLVQTTPHPVSTSAHAGAPASWPSGPWPRKI